jgi:hypothetical protein
MPTVMSAYPRLHLEQLQPVVQFGRKFGGSSEGDRTDTSKTVVERGVLSNTLTEWPTLEVDDERRDLLRKSQEVDRRVKQGRLVFRLEVDNSATVSKISNISSIAARKVPFYYSLMVRLGQVGHIDHRNHMDGELQQNREQDI